VIKEINQAQMEELLNKGAALIDVREEEELESGIIPGHIHMPLSDFDSYSDQLPKDRPIVFYCRSGRRSLAAAELAREWTTQDLYSLAGGILEYRHK
jgi:rhodanese-related sulfurtransferase